MIVPVTLAVTDSAPLDASRDKFEIKFDDQVGVEIPQVVGLESSEEEDSPDFEEPSDNQLRADDFSGSSFDSDSDSS